MGLLQVAYDGVLTQVGVEWCNALLFPSLVALGTFHSVCFVFSVFDLYYGRIDKWVMAECSLVQLVSHVVANSWAFYMFGDLKWGIPRQAPGNLEFLFGLVGCFVVGDFFIYWEHVWMHRIKFFRHYIHGTHHKYTSPMFSWCAGYVHPVEIAVALVCELAFPLAFEVHPFTLWVFITLWVFLLVEEHCGYDLPWSPCHILPFHAGGGNLPHALHHKPLTTKNFAFVFAIWDVIFGTYADPSSEPRKNL